MGKNKRIPQKMSVIAEHTMHVGAVLLSVFAMAIVNLLARSSCSQLQEAIGAKEKGLERLENERQRESARWEEMKTPERLEGALRRMGLAMRYPHADQVIYMAADGRPRPAQLAVAKAQQRLAERAAATAQVRPVSRRR